MAPALFQPSRESYNTEVTSDPNQQLSHHRRALVPVDNISTPMEEDDMGLQDQPSLAKDSQEMEQILVDLGSSDLAQADLLQAIKTLESGGDTLSTGDADAIFPFDLAEAVDSEGDASEDKIRLMQARLERRCAFLTRRLRILQARSIGKRVSEEASQVFEKCTRAARRDGGGRPMGLKALLKRIETTSALQASAASRSVAGPKYYRAGSSSGDAARTASLGIPSGTLTGLQDTAGALRSHLSVVKHELDSDATLSSSGAESNDEAVSYNNPHQQPMPLEKRALWSWQRARASIAARWGWLQAQVQELEYKIRQHSDLQKQVREAKGSVELEGTSPPEAAAELPEGDPAAETCSRHRPLRRGTFKKRKLLQMHNLHIATNKAAKPSDIRCSCRHGVESCPVCTGRAEMTYPAPPRPALPPPARLALHDPAYHPVLSDVHDITREQHVAALVSRPWLMSRCTKWRRTPRAPHPAHSTPHSTPHATPQPSTSSAADRRGRRHPTRLKRGRPPLSRRIRERSERDHHRDEESSMERRGRPSTESRSYRRQSYDIDNIVIPQSVAANTRPEILTYKEIITPKWRVLDVPEVPLNNGIMKNSRMSTEESEDEDISDAALRLRHSRAECSERGRWRAAVPPRRHGHVPPLTDVAPAPPAPHPPDTVPVTVNNGGSSHDESVRPYTPRKFPLPDDTYLSMVSVMPEGHTGPILNAISSPDSIIPDDDSSTLSPLSNTPFDGDDPDDDEWDPSVEKKVERRKPSFR